MAHKVTVGEMSMEFDVDCTTIQYSHMLEPVSTRRVGAQAIRELGDMILELDLTDGEYELCKRANEKFAEHFYHQWGPLQEVAQQLVGLEFKIVENAVKRQMTLEDALRRAWDYADKNKVPRDLSDEVRALLAGVPDRRA